MPLFSTVATMARTSAPTAGATPPQESTTRPLLKPLITRLGKVSSLSLLQATTTLTTSGVYGSWFVRSFPPFHPLCATALFLSCRYPAYHSNTIAVAALQKTKVVAAFTNYGAWVDISAPGGWMDGWIEGGREGTRRRRRHHCCCPL